MGYKIGDKFVIEIDKIFRHGSEGEPRYKIKGFNTLMFDDAGLDKLEPLKPDKPLHCTHNVQISELEANRLITMFEPYVVIVTPPEQSVQYYPSDFVKFTVRGKTQHHITNITYKILVVDTNGYYTTLYMDTV